MQIEIAEPGRMTQSGSSLLRLIQNNKTPVLDLLVRESIQNSLDAHIADTRSVTVEFRTGGFSSHQLGEELEEISSALERRFHSDECQFLAICDSNTVGLTGPMDVREVRNNNYGNLLKLVYEICKPQEAEGAGGSWGLGKTVYFRIGIGLVIYYSRIKMEDGTFTSRLAASFVENENASDAMIPEYKGMARRGIAWWGRSISENTTVPVTGESEIRRFLDIFGIKPYSGNKTGTMIIIPYIDRDLLLANNRIDYTDDIDEHFAPYWYASLEEYLRISVQRWYAPRLANPYYPYGAFLKVLVNGKGISADSMEPVFKVVQSLYNRANHVDSEDYLSENNAEVTVGDATVRKFLSDSVAGNIACVKLPRKILGLEAPHNKPEPSVYFNCEITDKAVNRPLVFYVRQPGMIVSYENISAWTAGIPSTDKGEYIFGLFVLNSLNQFKVDERPVEKLEEYVRKSEMADHTSWNDWSYSHFNPRIISKIQKSVNKVIGNQYTGEYAERKPKENSELSRYLGDLVLPPDGFGNAANNGSQKPRKDSHPQQKPVLFAVRLASIKYYADMMTIPIDLKTASNKKITHAAYELQIDSDAGKISLKEWESGLGLKIPFFINGIVVNIDTIDGEKTETQVSVTHSGPTASFRDIGFSLRTTKDGTAYGLDVSSSTEHSVRMSFSTTLRILNKNVRPSFVFEKEGK